MGFADHFDCKDFNACLDAIGSNHSDPYNDFVYEFFRENDPGHFDPVATFRKFVFLDNVYSAGLDKYMTRTPIKVPIADHRANVKESYWYLAHQLHNQHATTFSEVVGAIGNAQELRQADLKQISDKVNTFADLIKEAMKISTKGPGAGAKSFASKYLHFHLGIVPVLDSRASRSLAAMEVGFVRMTKPRIAKLGQKQKKPEKKSVSYLYGEFIERFFAVAQKAYAKEDGFSAKEIKDLDGYLYYCDREDWAWPIKEGAI